MERLHLNGQALKVEQTVEKKSSGYWTDGWKEVNVVSGLLT
jgi:hypothetical protein